MRSPRHSLATLACVGLAACGGGGTSEDAGDGSTSSAAGSTSAAPSTTVVSTTAAPTTTSAVEPGPAISLDGTTYTIDWAALPTTPFYDPSAGSDADPFFHIHTDGAGDGFFFAFEMFTTGYGALWTGETGAFPLGCAEPAPAPNSTGICLHFDPDGPGAATDLNADFAATGSITIDRLDADGYDIAVGQLTFSDGTTIAPFTMAG